MTEHRRVGIFDRLDDPRGLGGFAQAEIAVHGCDDVVERLQNVFGVVQRPVGEDVGLDAKEQSEVPELLVERHGFLALLFDALRLEPVGVGGGLAVVAQAEELVAQRPGRVDHLLHGRFAVAVVGVAVNHAPYIGFLDQCGQSLRPSGFGRLDLAQRLSQLGRNVRESQFFEQRGLVPAARRLAAFEQTVLVETIAEPFGPRANLGVVILVAGEVV